LLVCQEQNWEKYIEMGDEGSLVLLQIPHFVGGEGKVFRCILGGITYVQKGLKDLEDVKS